MGTGRGVGERSTGLGTRIDNRRGKCSAGRKGGRLQRGELPVLQRLKTVNMCTRDHAFTFILILINLYIS